MNKQQLAEAIEGYFGESMSNLIKDNLVEHIYEKQGKIETEEFDYMLQVRYHLDEGSPYSDWFVFAYHSDYDNVREHYDEKTSTENKENADWRIVEHRSTTRVLDTSILV